MNKKKAVEKIKDEVQEVAAVAETVVDNEILLDSIPEAVENNELLETQIKNVIEDNGEFVTPDNLGETKVESELSPEDFDAIGSNTNKVDEETEDEVGGIVSALRPFPNTIPIPDVNKTLSADGRPDRDTIIYGISNFIDHNKELGRSSAATVITENEQQEIMDVDEWLNEAGVRYEFYRKNGELKVQFDW